MRDGVQARHGAVDLVQTFAVTVHVGDRGHQACGVRVSRVVDDLVHRADFGHAPGVQHGHAVTGFGDHAHVVGDQHHGSTPVFADLFEQADDLRLNGHIERGGRLVGHNQLRFGSQGQGDHHPLAHAARKLVRVMVDALFGGRNAGVLEQLDRTLPRLLGRHGQVGQNGLGQLPADGIQRVERGQRVLKNRTNLAAPNVAHLIGIQVVDALSFQQYLPPGHAAWRLQKANDGRARERLACARLAHHAQNFTGGDVERNIVQRTQRAVAAGEFHHQVFDL